MGKKMDRKKSFDLGAVHKRRPHSGGFVQFGHFADKVGGGVLQMGSSHFLRKKIRIF